MTAEGRVAQAGSFGAAAGVYERGRPGYPEEALDWLLPRDAHRVLDLGAGTGKLTRQLVARGLDVVAVEPADGMRAQLLRVVPGATALPGSAESIPLADASVDAVLVAQAWHWVDVPRAVPEVARVLRPGGRLGLVWNTRDERVGWVAELSRIMAGGVEHFDLGEPPVGPPFAPIERRDFAWSHPLTPDALVDLVASRSCMIIAPADRREATFAAVRRLLAEHPDLAGCDRFEMPYVTQCSRADLG